MSIASEITRIKANIGSAYSAVGAKGGTLPGTQNSANLPAAIESIPAGGGGGGSSLPFGLTVSAASADVTATIPPDLMMRVGDAVYFDVTVTNNTDTRKWITMTLKDSNLMGFKYNADGTAYYPVGTDEKYEIADFNDVLMFRTVPVPSLYLTPQPEVRDTNFHFLANIKYDRAGNNYTDSPLPFPENLPDREYKIYGKPELYMAGFVFEKGAAGECEILEPDATLTINIGVYFSSDYTILDRAVQETRYPESDLSVFDYKFFKLGNIEIGLEDME